MKNKTDITTVRYRLPDQSADEYALNALAILEKIHNESPELLPYFIEPNAVLTLSGVRAFNTYTGFEETVDRRAVERLKGLLTDDNIQLVVAERVSKSSNKLLPKYYLSYDTLNLNALAALKSQYPFVSITMFKLPLTPQELDVWINKTIIQIKKQIERGDLGKRAKNDKCEAEHVLFGILFGYPLEAIIDISSERYEGGENYISADIKYANIYNCAQPTYFYHKQLISDNLIIAHGEIWSRILEIVYDSPLHKKVSQEKDFVETRNEMEKWS